ncbi:MAG: lipid-A-disaccharide synthase [Bacteroidota bacterium]
MRYYLIAGERSGDLHGSNLVKAIKQLDAVANFRGIGGEYMKDAGVALTINYGSMAFMGFFEVFKNLRTIKKYITISRQDILDYKPDVVILIDYAGFNRQMASFCHKKNIRVFYYISPKVWAWHQRRALHLKHNVDKMFVILPFEKSFYKKYDWDVDYVGNPVLDAVKNFKADPLFIQKHNFSGDKPLVALLPGSRKQELERILPLMAKVANRFPNFQFAVATVSNLDPKLYDPVKGLTNVTTISEDTYNLLHHAHAAIVTSGTATLETALFKVPQVVVYKTGQAGYTIARWVVSVEFISLVNLIADKEVVKELIQQEANEVAVAGELQKLVLDEAYKNEVIANYNNIYKTLDIGSASANAARLMVKYLNAGMK